MRKGILTLLIGVCLAQIPSVGQTRIDVERQGKGVSHLAPPFVSPIRTGETLPVECVIGDLFFLTTALAGNNIYVCHDDSSWLPQGSAGQASLEVMHQGESLGVRPSINLIPGDGVSYVITDTGSRINVQQSVNTAYLMTKEVGQSGAVLLCASSSDSATVYSCEMQPALTAMRSGMVIHWMPDVTNAAGGVTLALDALGPYSVKLADGLTEARAGDFRAGHLYPLWYDGTLFRVAQGPFLERFQTVAEDQAGEALFCTSVAGTGTAFDCSFSQPLVAYSVGMLLRWRPDVHSAGGPTDFEIDALGPKPLKMQDGVSDPLADELKAGELHLVWYDGSVFRVVAGPPRDMMTIHEHQGGQTLLCESSETVGQDFQCSMTPAPDQYRRGMVVHWLPDADALEGEVSLNINGLGVVAIKGADGISDPGGNTFQAGALIPLWYDGAAFRLFSDREMQLYGDVRPVCGVSMRGRLWFLPGGDEEADTLSVCAKNADDQYDWRVIY